jgi:hypothetical protein
MSKDRFTRQGGAASGRRLVRRTRSPTKDNRRTVTTVTHVTGGTRTIAQAALITLLGVGLTTPATATAATATAAAAATAATAATAAIHSTASSTASDRDVALTRWSSTRQFGRGTGDGVRADGGELRLARVTGGYQYRDPFGNGTTKAYDTARWTSPWVQPGFGLTEMVASWDATTPRGTWIQVAGRGRTGRGGTGSWDVLGRWAGHDAGFHRTSVRGQGDDYADVAVDTVGMNGTARYTAWQLKVTLLRPHGSSSAPTVQSVGAMASALPGGTPPTSRTSMRRTIDVDVPRWSQMIHTGEYPQYDNGGEAWCSPTTMAMLIGRWDAGPTPREYAWVNDSYAQPWVDHAARNTFDYSYDGAGNWPFSTAYAGKQDLDSFVTRLRSLREAERFVRAGIPLGVSVTFGRGELSGSPISSTAGHVLVVRGFTAEGDVIVNDPAAPSKSSVRRVYDRAQFERAWLPTSGGLTYVVHPAGVALPRRTAQSSW